jgi:hypothetical protein
MAAEAYSKRMAVAVRRELRQAAGATNSTTYLKRPSQSH